MSCITYSIDWIDIFATWNMLAEPLEYTLRGYITHLRYIMKTVKVDCNDGINED